MTMTKEEIIALVNKGRITQTGLVDGCSCADDKEFYATHVTQTGVAGNDLAESETPTEPAPAVPTPEPDPSPVPGEIDEEDVVPPAVPKPEPEIEEATPTTKKNRSKKSDAPSVAPEV